MRLKILFLGIILFVGIVNIGAVNYTPENIAISPQIRN